MAALPAQGALRTPTGVIPALLQLRQRGVHDALRDKKEEGGSQDDARVRKPGQHVLEE